MSPSPSRPPSSPPPPADWRLLRLWLRDAAVGVVVATVLVVSALWWDVLGLGSLWRGVPAEDRFGVLLMLWLPFVFLAGALAFAWSVFSLAEGPQSLSSPKIVRGRDGEEMIPDRADPEVRAPDEDSPRNPLI